MKRLEKRRVKTTIPSKEDDNHLERMKDRPGSVLL